MRKSEYSVFRIPHSGSRIQGMPLQLHENHYYIGKILCEFRGEDLDEQIERIYRSLPRM
jgi:hypothetical protein